MKGGDFEHQLRRAVAGEQPVSRDACPDAAALLAAAERRGPEDARLRTINHAMTCSACKEELELLRAMQVAQRRPLIQPRMWALAATFLLVVALGYWQLRPSGEDPNLRAGGEEITLLAPQRSVSGVQRLVWRPVPNATLYTVELRQDDGTLVLQESTSDTSLILPERVVLPRRDFYWTVAARLADGSDVRATPRRFRIQTP
ncbi:MAG TPA: hypothetical protein VJ717_06435 [Gemmatimonadaceae bacterium]|nr:hypothetical protein [Gemmatimonadaceae bacterium]